MTRAPWQLTLQLEGAAPVPLSGTAPAQHDPPARYEWRRRSFGRTLVTQHNTAAEPPIQKARR